jgi:hypothetical protein
MGNTHSGKPRKSLENPDFRKILIPELKTCEIFVFHSFLGNHAAWKTQIQTFSKYKLYRNS